MPGAGAKPPKNLTQKGGTPMNIRKSVLWQLPAYCLAVGVVCWRPLVWLLSRFAVKVTEEGGMKHVSAVQTGQLLVYGLLFAVTLAVGWLIFRKLTRRELLASAGVLAVIQILIWVLDWAGLMPASLSVQLSNLHLWSGLLIYLLPWGWLYYPAVLAAPCILALFGKKSAAR